jgi:hypothetical protein
MTVSAHVHRFHHFAAVAFTGIDGETVYMTAGDAAALADALTRCVADIHDRPRFTDSRFTTFCMPLSNGGSRRS